MVKKLLKTIIPLLLIMSIAALSGMHCAGVGRVSETYQQSFYKVPALEPDCSSDSSLTFIVYSDNQAGWRVTDVFLDGSRWTSWKMLIFPFYELYLLGNGIVGAVNGLRHVPDFGRTERILVRDAIYGEAIDSGASFVLNVGDMAAHDGRRPAHWATFIRENKIEHPLLNEIPYLPVIGNHEHANDTTHGYANYQAVFDYPRFYTTFCDLVDLFIVDSNLLVDQYRDIEDEEQDEIYRTWFISTDPDDPSWLQQQLAASTAPFRVVAIHNPLLSYGMHHDDWLDPENGTDLVRKRRELLDLFQEYQVDLVLSGHDHLYQHSELSYGDDRVMHFLIGGGGGSPLRPMTDQNDIAEYQRQFEDEGLDVKLVNMARVFHYYRIDVEPASLTVNVIEVTMEKKVPTRPLEQIAIEKK